MQEKNPLSVSDELLQEVREKFAHVETCPITGPRVFFENAGGALTLNSVVETSARFAAIPDNQGRDNEASKFLDSIIDKCREDLGLFFNASDGQMIVGESGTELLYRLISAAATGADKGIILGSTLEHPATRSACHQWSERTGMSHVLVKHDNSTGLVTAEDYERHVSPDVQIATIVHTSPVTGMSVDVAAISRSIRKTAPNAMIIVDGIQHASHGGIDVNSYDIDGYVISPYKVFSRHGYGVAWLSDRLSQLPHNCLVGGNPLNWEMGTRDTGSYATMSDVISYFEWLGSQVSDSDDRRDRIVAAGEAIRAHEKTLTDAMLFGAGNLKGLAEMDGVNIVGGVENPHREGLVSLWMDDIDSSEIVSSLKDSGVRVHIRNNDHYCGNILEPLGLKNCVRVSLCHYNSLPEVAKFLTAMAEIAGD